MERDLKTNKKNERLIFHVFRVCFWLKKSLFIFNEKKLGKLGKLSSNQFPQKLLNLKFKKKKLCNRVLFLRERRWVASKTRKL